MGENIVFKSCDCSNSVQFMKAGSKKLFLVKQNMRLFLSANIEPFLYRLENVGILGKESEPGVGNLGWYGEF